MAETIECRDVFCGVCGTFFDLRQTGTEYICRKCGTVKTCANRLMFSRSVAQYPAATAWLNRELSKRKGGTPIKNKDDEEEEDQIGAQRALVTEECGKCKNPKMYFWTQQLRSADFGQTVFYECPKCNNRLSINS